MRTRFSARPDRPWGRPSLLYKGYWVFPGGKERPERDADPSPPSSSVVKKEQSCTSTPPMGRTACTEPQCLYSTAIPVLPIWAVRPVQSLLYNEYRVFPRGKVRPGRDADPSPPSSAVVKKEQSYTSTPPMGHTACTEPQCLYNRAIPLLPLWVVQPVQSLSACTVELYL